MKQQQPSPHKNKDDIGQKKYFCLHCSKGDNTIPRFTKTKRKPPRKSQHKLYKDSYKANVHILQPSSKPSSNNATSKPTSKSVHIHQGQARCGSRIMTDVIQIVSLDAAKSGLVHHQKYTPCKCTLVHMTESSSSHHDELLI